MKRQLCNVGTPHVVAYCETLRDSDERTKILRDGLNRG